ncbi:non-ribosomal peptide synthetase [Clostridium sp. C8-1-8]|uniref:non-ribosomal peptide synthetase n=1 Tax=Clostridium sp. C8-1-8 TaxID=2698831 RepID=UPI00136C092C|nr:non-ribosomal peptide synthetase [Clostridium sp. C8-1-8]
MLEKRHINKRENSVCKIKKYNKEIKALEVIKKQEEYWLKIFDDDIPALDIPTDYKRTYLKDFRRDKVCFTLDRTLTEKLKKISISNEATLYMTLLSAYNVLLSKYSGQEDIVVGSPVLVEDYNVLRNTSEGFINFLPMRNYPEGKKNFKEFLQEVREKVVNCYENQAYKFEALVEKLSIKKDLKRNPLFDTMLVLKHTGDKEKVFDSLAFNKQKEALRLDLILEAKEIDNRIVFEVEYCTNLFNRKTIERLVEHFTNILKVVIANQGIRISDIDMLSEEEKKKILVTFMGNKIAYPKDKTINMLFEEQVEKTPNKTALVFQEKKLTYRELNERSNKLARTLKHKGVGPETIVAIMVEPSIEMIVGIMAVLKAEGAYLPIDTKYPKDRIKYMLQNSGARLLLTTKNLMDIESHGAYILQEDVKESFNYKGEIIFLEEEHLYVESPENLDIAYNSKNLAYVIYTSGTTGKPKGVMLNHIGISNLKVVYEKDMNISDEDKIIQFASFAFDASVWEITMALLNGAELHLLPKEIIDSYISFRDYLNHNEITVATLPPAYLTNIDSKEIKTLRLLITAGSAISESLLCKWKDKVHYINAYGPTETTICSTIWHYNDEASDNLSVPIGKPINNYSIYILDKNNSLLPIGVVGELCVSGEGLARGYLNREELTKEKFIDNPFEPGEKMYKTGDLARWLPDGNLEFMGRIDDQVKIRGFRIELGEIESQLLKEESIKEVVVIDREDKEGSKYLCAYFVSDKDIKAAELKEYLLSKLPAYMIPSYFIKLEKLPLTSNGKIDKKALPEPILDIKTGVEYVEPRKDIEKALESLWSQILGVNKIGIDDDFFTLGGHSLKAMQIAAAIQKQYKVELSVGDIFNNSTLRKLGKYIEKSKESGYSNIEAIEEQEFYKVSSAQKRMFALNQLAKDDTNYNLPVVATIEGRLKREKFEEIILKLIERHEAFRTSFKLVDNEIMQKVQKKAEFALDYIELKDEKKEVIDEIIKAFVKPFDLSKAPLVRVKLVRLKEEKHILMFDMHHIISDGTSMNILIEEFKKLYQSEELEQLRLQYKDYSAWENQLQQSEDMKKQEQYWLKLFEEDIPVLDMPTDYPRPSFQSFEGDSVSFKFDEALTEKLNKLARDNGATLYMTLLAAYNILLAKYSGQEDIIVGSPIAGRKHSELQNIVGMFVNTLAMRNHPEGTKNFKKFLQEVKQNALSAYDNQEYQFDKLVEALKLRRDSSRNALFDTVFVLQNTDSGEISFDGLRIKPYEFKSTISKFDITLEAKEKGKEIIFKLEYCTKLFKRDTIERLKEHFINILKAVTANQEILISEIDMVSVAEKEKMLLEFNATEAYFTKDKTIKLLFEEQAAKTPNNIAVVFKEDKLTYRELNKKSNQLAKLLKSKGVGPESIVGIMVEPSLEMIVGIMAILKAEGAYLPIDIKYPKDRIEYMLQDSGARLLLTKNNMKYDNEKYDLLKINSMLDSEEMLLQRNQEGMTNNIRISQREKLLIDELNFNGEIIHLDDTKLYEGDSSNLTGACNSNNLAYVIYTSGSTGKPKGVMLEHKSLINMCKWYEKYYNLCEKDRGTKYAGFGFDASVWEIFPYLIVGASIYVLEDNIRLDLLELNEYYKKNNITISFLPTQVCEQFMLLDNDKLRFVLAGGDKLKQYKVTSYKVVNNYGPTENTIVTTSFILDKEYNNIPIGKPISNCRVYIVDKYNKLQPIGVPGELCIAGAGLARGYLNREALTKEKFVANPFEADTRMYKTGDLARWLPDGNIEFLGRIDYQVKIRGFRIELGEIENELVKNVHIKEAVVLDRQDKQENKYLCAYFTAEKEINVGDLRKELSQSLPDYMIPAYFIQLEKMPLTANGKVDRKALPEPSGEVNTGAKYVAARNKKEEELIKIYEQTLGINRIGIDDDFFVLGGHSLKAIQLVALVQKEFKIELSVREIFNNPTIRQLEQYIEAAKRLEYTAIAVVEERERYEVSSAQKRMFTLNQLATEKTNYNIPMAFIMEGTVEKAKMEQSFRELIERHEALRTSFELVDNELMQRIHEKVEFKLEYEEVAIASEQAIKLMVDSFIKSFDLSKAPLFRANLVKLEQEKYLLLLDMHHIISDGTSMNILLEEFTKLYQGERLQELKIQYKDYSAWENIMQGSKVMKKQEEYWLKVFENNIPVLDMPTDYKRPNLQSFEGNIVSFNLEEALTEKLNKIARDNGATLYMTLLASYNILLSKYSGQEDIIVGSPIAGRNHDELQNIVGMFINTLAMRNYPVGEKSFKEFLKEVRKNVLDAYENQDYQFDRLVDTLKLKRESSRNALFDTMFVLQNTEQMEMALDNITIKPYEIKSTKSKFDITLEAKEVGNEINFKVEYCTKLFKKDTINRLTEHFINILKSVIANPEVSLSEIDMLSEGEKNKILVNFKGDKVAYPKDKTINELFEEQVEKTPDNTALVFKEKKLTYIELNKRANKLARILKSKGVGAETIVAIMIEPSIEMVVAIMAVLKAEGAYLPIDTKYPKDRIEYMLQDSGAKLLLTKRNTDVYDIKVNNPMACIQKDKTQESFSYNEEVISLEEEQLYEKSSENLALDYNPKNLAYVIYTSGTTGRPKGVMVTHLGISNLKVVYEKNMKIDKEDKVIQFASLSFDASVWEITMALLNGSELHILPKEIINNYEDFTNYLNDKKITVATLPPAYLNNLDSNEINTLRLLMTAGSAISKNVLYKWKDKVHYINAYGPTETTICSTLWHYSDEGSQNVSVPIGTPINNYSVYILDKTNCLVPIGVVGELCVSGEGLARGYLNREGLTKEKFIDNPFEPGVKMYKTGDLARWLPDGNIEFMGRIDDQVKIRGFRIELGEIESQILKEESIKEAVVIDREDQEGSKYLCAYVISDKEIKTTVLREHLLNKLPAYMIPSYFIKLEKMPLTSNGKIDKKALPEPKLDFNTEVKYTEPRNDIEKVLVEVWSQILGVKSIGIDDDFFTLGGDSIKAIKVAFRLSKYNLKILVNELFANPTIRQLSLLARKINEEEEKTAFTNEGVQAKSLYTDKESIDFKSLKETSTEKEEMNNKLQQYEEKIKLYENINLNKINSYENILLVGSTGYLGIHILYDLLKNKSSKLYLIIRGNTKEAARERLLQKLSYYFEEDIIKIYEHRIFILNGDISKSKLNLEKSEYEELDGKIDCIINSAANVKHYGKYSDFYEINVKGTKNLIEFAKYKKLKDYNHISTLSIANGSISNSSDVVFTEYDCDLGQKEDNYYIQTKLQSEKEVLKAREEGLICNIFRVGNLVFNSSTGKFQENIKENAFYSIIRAYINLNLMPKATENDIDLSYIDYVSKAITSLFDRSELINETYHVKNEYLLSTYKLGQLINKEGYHLQFVSLEDFFKFVGQDNSDDLQQYKDALSLHLNLMGQKSTTNFLLTCKKTNMLLERLDFGWLKPKQELITKMIEHGKRIGFF